MADATSLRAGDEVDAWCTKCRKMHIHTVKAIDPTGKKVPRVICPYTQTERNYRPHPPKSLMKKKKKPAEEPNPWKDLVTNVREDRVIPYTISSSFGEGDFLQHKKYGLGVVTEVLDATKIMVAFEDRKRVMVCNK